MRFLSICGCYIVILLSCKNEPLKQFSKLSESETGIDFRNLLKEDNPDFNILQYPYFYNGSGVAVGDINNDGLPDICFTGNMVKNRLYINKGNFKFEDVTQKSGIATKEGWCTGITMVDINEDGKLDIYICRSGLSNKAFRKNLLFINNGDLTFTEKAAEYGLDDAGYSTQASFFDYDKDGDIDMFLINQSAPEYSKAQTEYAQLRLKEGDSSYHNKLYRNDGGHFINANKVAGIHSNVLTFSLGLSTADINQDGWPDVYVANDFNEQDYLYINNHDGTFTESLKNMIGHVSQYSMGCDVADYNNDLLPDICVLDMLPENNHDLKMHVGADNFDKFQQLFDQGYYYQYMKNSLQRNNGDGSFSDVAFLSGVAATDWSWSPLLADFDNDGWKDIFITNGYKRDNTNIQFVKFTMDENLRLSRGGEQISVNNYINKMEGIHIPNYLFKNNANEQFENKAADWGLEEKTFSHGAIYADLDNDGDLDLVVNNTDSYAGVYRNNTEKINRDNRYIRIKLEGTKQNPAGIGTKIWIYTKEKTIYQEQLPVRGFQSSVDAAIVAGLGNEKKMDSIRIIWPDNKTQLLVETTANQTLNIDHRKATGLYEYQLKNTVPLFQSAENVLAFTHREAYVNDFSRQFLLPHFYSNEGPKMTQADVNGDGRADVYICGSKGQAGQLFLQTAPGNFMAQKEKAFEADAMAEDAHAIFFDAEGDGDQDLYVASGSYEFEIGDNLLQDRLYLNNAGHFSKAADALPVLKINTSCLAAADFDADGDIDLFVGGGVVPGNYPKYEQSFILLNNGKGKFTDATEKFAPQLKSAGLLHDAKAVDMNRDGINDLVLAGEWMPVKIFISKKNSMADETAVWCKNIPAGWWQSLAVADFDKDGDLDMVAGNYGLNSALRAMPGSPVNLFYLDYDGNGSTDPFLTNYTLGRSYPFGVMDDITGQVPMLRKKFFGYLSYADATINDVLGDKLPTAIKLQVDDFRTCYFENTGTGFKPVELPVMAQLSPACALLATDVNADGILDIIVAGNNRNNRIRIGLMDANYGTVLLGNGKGKFQYLYQARSGLHFIGDVRSLLKIGNTLLAGINDRPVQVYKMK